MQPKASSTLAAAGRDHCLARNNLFASVSSSIKNFKWRSVEAWKKHCEERLLVNIQAYWCSFQSFVCIIMKIPLLILRVLSRVVFLLRKKTLVKVPSQFQNFCLILSQLLLIFNFKIIVWAFWASQTQTILDILEFVHDYVAMEEVLFQKLFIDCRGKLGLMFLGWLNMLRAFLVKKTLSSKHSNTIIGHLSQCFRQGSIWWEGATLFLEVLFLRSALIQILEKLPTWRLRILRDYLFVL